MMRVLVLLFFVVTLPFLDWSGIAQAFHGGGVGPCEGCHTMHNSLGNMRMAYNSVPQFTSNAYLLQGSDQSSTCLNCHAGQGSYHVASTGTITSTSIPANYTPAGDFAWLKVSTSALASDGVTMVDNPGFLHGHSIVAADYGYDGSSNVSAAEGGTYPALALGCQSCHDPHGGYRINSAYRAVGPSAVGQQVPPIIGPGSYGDKDPGTLSTGNNGLGEAVGTYRLLAGSGYSPHSLNGSYLFANDPPFAFSPTLYNKAENGVSDQTIVAYGSGMSEWCQNCHTNIHDALNPTYLQHPTGNAAKLTADLINNYNSYVYTGNLSGSAATAYLSLVPFERGVSLMSGTWSLLLSSVGATNGPDANSNVQCLTCHRAHASAWPYLLRFNADTGPAITIPGPFMTISGAYPGIDSTVAEGTYGQYTLGYSQAQQQAGYYGRPASQWATYQRSLCNKCHVQD